MREIKAGDEQTDVSRGQGEPVGSWDPRFAEGEAPHLCSSETRLLRIPQLKDLLVAKIIRRRLVEHHGVDSLRPKGEYAEGEREHVQALRLCDILMIKKCRKEELCATREEYFGMLNKRMWMKKATTYHGGGASYLTQAPPAQPPTRDKDTRLYTRQGFPSARLGLSSSITNGELVTDLNREESVRRDVDGFEKTRRELSVATRKTRRAAAAWLDIAEAIPLTDAQSEECEQVAPQEREAKASQMTDEDSAADSVLSPAARPYFGLILAGKGSGLRGKGRWASGDGKRGCSVRCACCAVSRRRLC
ncbi:hypothetical protein IMY05_C4856000300 [Salix suchowensis]|nr:hypothetical protein IMY05_C4856000300 [Salix suchowensis]